MKSGSSPALVPRWLTSAGILLGSLILTYAPLPGFKQTIVVVSGSELEEPLRRIEATFEDRYPSLDVQLEFQGSQDMIDRYRSGENRFTPTVLIPASEDFLAQLDPQSFYDRPQGIVQTYLVAVVWPERAQALFPNGQWDWSRLETGLLADRRSWGQIGGQESWGSFDFMITDPSRSNSGQLALTLWLEARLSGPLTSASFSNPVALDLLRLVKRSVYEPARSTDNLLQEFITRGPNDADVAIVYESIALYRWSQTQGRPYQIFYPDPTIETTATAAILRQGVNRKMAQGARTFVNFLRQPEQQTVFVTFGFRPVLDSVDVMSVAESPWNQNIPGAIANVSIQSAPPPLPEVILPLVQAWEQAQ
ncbi:MAG: substrate-binding domain-containing protein [Prochlorotrichaceae cyanobacterium]